MVGKGQVMKDCANRGEFGFNFICNGNLLKSSLKRRCTRSYLHF